MSKQYSVNSLNKYRIGNAIVQPSIMKGGVLNDYQIEALEWMVDLASQSSNAILADDMGLGKTIQALSYLAYLKEEHGIRGKHLIVCPKTVCINWLKEATKWLPTFRAVILPNTQLER